MSNATHTADAGTGVTAQAIGKVQHCTTMAEVRARIDALDDVLVPLLVERSGYMTQAARIKQSDAQVRDVARIEAIVRRVRAAAQAEGGQPDLIEAIYRGIMEASIAYEHREFARLRAGHASDAAAQQTAGSAA
ncbi:chorismate mutase [Acidovorax sp. NPDC077693]|uniref:chorismate mutase n=1 Tax=unclassified Acidovorax TaxID=2684926 RepID=UPI0037C5B9BD